MPRQIDPNSLIVWSLDGNTDTLTLREFAAQALIHLPALAWIMMGTSLATRGIYEAPELGRIEITNRIAEAA